MNKDNIDSYELSMGLYKEVLKSLGKKGKKMFNFLNKAGDKYREAIYCYMRRIINNETVPGAFLITWLIAIWKRKGSGLVLDQVQSYKENGTTQQVGIHRPSPTCQSGRTAAIASHRRLRSAPT